MSLFSGGRREPRERTEEERRQAMIDRERRRSGDASWTPPPGHPLAPPAGSPAQSAPSAAPAGAEPVLRPARPAQPAAAAQPAPSAPTAPTNQAAPPAAPVVHPDDAGWWDEPDSFGSEQPVAAWPPPAPGAPAQPPAPVAPAQAPASRSAQPAPAGPVDPAPARRRPVAPASAAAAAAAAAAAQAGAGSARPAAPEPVKIDPEPRAQPPAPAFDLPDHRQVAVHRRRSFASRSTSRTVVSPPGDANMGGSLGRGRTRRRKLALLVVFLFLAGVAWTQWVLWQPFKGGGSEEISVQIPEGSGASEVGERLYAAGVVDSARLFTLRAVIAGQRNDLPSGEVKLKQDMSYGAALAALTGGTVVPTDLLDLTIPEGLSIREIAARFKRQNTVDGYGATAVKVLRERRDELRADYGVPKNARTLEGLLFPSTYQLPAGFTARDLIDRQLQAFEQNFGGVSMTKAEKANLTPYEVLTIASMVEREARLTRERPLIAAVIYNRLKAGMPLGIDATFRYASGNWNDPIKQSELDKDGPFNSRTRTGLPPTPIGNPGLASIEAAANPAKVPYLYFVVKPGRCGEHAFAATAEKFAQDSAKYNAARDAAGGSPDTC